VNRAYGALLFRNNDHELGDDKKDGNIWAMRCLFADSADNLTIIGKYTTDKAKQKKHLNTSESSEHKSNDTRALSRVGKSEFEKAI
jgi:hypothetical protein